MNYLNQSVFKGNKKIPLKNERDYIKSMVTKTMCS